MALQRPRRCGHPVGALLLGRVGQRQRLGDPRRLVGNIQHVDCRRVAALHQPSVAGSGLETADQLGGISVTRRLYIVAYTVRIGVGTDTRIDVDRVIDAVLIQIGNRAGELPSSRKRALRRGFSA